MAIDGCTMRFETKGHQQKAPDAELIADKIKFGKRLTRDEMNFIKNHNPDLYARVIENIPQAPAPVGLFSL